MLYTLATFGVGFLTRPLGAWVLGCYGDRAGRRPAMVLSFALMGAGILGVALIPGYERIGIAAPTMLVAFRLLQGFALGGEVGTSTAYLVEAAPAGRRGLYVALQYTTQDVAVIASGLVGYGLSSALSAEQLDDWGWRVAFALGGTAVPLGLWLRGSLPETLAPAHGPSAPRRREQVPVRLAAVGMLLLAASAVSNYVLTYITTYAQDSLHLGTKAAFIATAVLGTAQCCADLTAGVLSDRFGRRPIMFLGLAALILCTVPAFTLMDATRDTRAVYSGMALLGMLLSVASGPMIVSIAESLPMRARAAALATMYAMALTCFGGTTQFVIKWLIDASGSALAPAWYMTGALVLGLCGGLLLRESAPVRTGRLVGAADAA